jgi:hypothetical protein
MLSIPPFRPSAVLPGLRKRTRTCLPSVVTYALASQRSDFTTGGGQVTTDGGKDTGYLPTILACQLNSAAQRLQA